MPNLHVVNLTVAAMACTAAACGGSPAAPDEPRFALVAVDGQAVPYQVGVTTAGQALTVYSGQVYQIARTGQCAFYVSLNPKKADLSFANEYVGMQSAPCILVKGEQKSFTYTFQFRNSTANTARTYTYE